MKVLMLSRDAKILDSGSAVQARMIEYGTLFDELHIVVLNKKAKSKNKNDIVKIKNVTIYPTSSWFLALSFCAAYKIGKKIIENWKLKIENSRDFVVTSQDPFETGLVAFMISRRLKVSLHLQIHTDFLSPYFIRESLKNRIRVFIAKRILKKANCIRVVSEKIKNSIVSSFKFQVSNISVLPIFTDAEKIKVAKSVVLSREFGFTILWVGRLEKEKNPALAIEAFAQLVKKVPNAGLVIIGDGSEREALKFQVSSFKLQEEVLFLGWKDNVADYYKSADVLLVTSRYEGYGMQMVEARISGISVVAPDVGIAREVGAYITEYSAESMAQTLIQLHNSTLKARGEYMYPYANKKQYLELYKRSFECLPH